MGVGVDEVRASCLCVLGGARCARRLFNELDRLAARANLSRENPPGRGQAARVQGRHETKRG